MRRQIEHAEAARVDEAQRGCRRRSRRSDARAARPAARRTAAGPTCRDAAAGSRRRRGRPGCTWRGGRSPISRRPTRRSARRSGSGKRRSGRRWTSAVICRPRQPRGQRAHRRLDFGQLRHRSPSPAPGGALVGARARSRLKRERPAAHGLRGSRAMTDPLDHARERLATSFGYQEVPARGQGPRWSATCSRGSRGRYDLMNDLMSARRAPAVEGGADRLAGAAPGPAPARRRGRHRRHRVSRARPRRARAGAPPRIVGLRHQPGDARGRPRPGDRPEPARRRSTGCAPMPRRCRCADRSVDAYTIAFGIRNVTRIERALAEAQPRAAAGRAVPLPRVLAAAAAPALRRALRRLLLHRGAVARRAGRRRPRGLPVSGREHPALSRPGDLRAA